MDLMQWQHTGEHRPLAGTSLPPGFDPFHHTIDCVNLLGIVGLGSVRENILFLSPFYTPDLCTESSPEGEGTLSPHFLRYFKLSTYSQPSWVTPSPSGRGSGWGGSYLDATRLKPNFYSIWTEIFYFSYIFIIIYWIIQSNTAVGGPPRINTP